jgi:dipeptidyl aminopeptidase/acylaminoacyl peptidase
MKTKIILVFTIIFCFFHSQITLTAQRGVKHLPLQLFFQEPAKTSFQISPSGSHFAYLATEGNTRHLFVSDFRSGKTHCATLTFKGEIERHIWLNEKVLVCQSWDPIRNINKLYRVDLISEKWDPLIENKSEGVKFFNTREKRAGCVFVLLEDGAQKSWQPYLLNVETGYLKRLATNPGKINDWILDHGGQCRIATHTQGSITRIQFRRQEEERFHTILAFDNVIDFFQPLVFTPDNKHIYAYSNLNRDRTALVEFDPLQQKEVKVIYEDPIYDLFGDDEVDFVCYSKKENQLAYLFYTTWKRKYHFFNNRYEKLISELAKRFNRHVIRIVSSNDEENMHVVKVSSDRIRGEYFLFDEQKNLLYKLGNSYPWLKESDMACKKPIRFKSRDGLVIHGYVTIPPAITPRNLPLVVIPHGGPRWRDCWEMGRFTEIQLFANRGYAVLQVNFRGSSGYGKAFTRAGFKQNGLKVQNDITDGINDLIKRQIVDKEKIAILGASYGGYAALAGLTFTPDFYVCGVDLFGVSNFFTFLNNIPPWFDRGGLYRTIGHPEKDCELLKKTSPLFHVDRIKVPVLIAQGGKDPVVKRSESDQMVEALKKHNIPVRYIMKEDEGHGYFRNKENRFELWEAIDRFLKKHLSEKDQNLQADLAENEN